VLSQKLVLFGGESFKGGTYIAKSKELVNSREEYNEDCGENPCPDS